MAEEATKPDLAVNRATARNEMWATGSSRGGSGFFGASSALLGRAWDGVDGLKGLESGARLGRVLSKIEHVALARCFYDEGERRRDREDRLRKKLEGGNASWRCTERQGRRGGDAGRLTGTMREKEETTRAMRVDCPETRGMCREMQACAQDVRECARRRWACAKALTLAFFQKSRGFARGSSGFSRENLGTSGKPQVFSGFSRNSRENSGETLGNLNPYSRLHRFGPKTFKMCSKTVKNIS